jgi:sulfur carrier protein ThiS
MRIYLGGYFSFYHPEKAAWLELELDEPALLSEVLAGLGIPPVEVNLAVVNGEIVEPEARLVRQGDEVRLYPPIAGG